MASYSPSYILTPLHVSLKLLPARDGVYLLAPSIWLTCDSLWAAEWSWQELTSSEPRPAGVQGPSIVSDLYLSHANKPGLACHQARNMVQAPSGASQHLAGPKKQVIRWLWTHRPTQLRAENHPAEPRQNHYQKNVSQINSWFCAQS